MNPYRRPPLSDAADQAITEAAECSDKIRILEKQRAGAVRRAIVAGASLREISTRIGVSSETVRKMGGRMK